MNLILVKRAQFHFRLTDIQWLFIQRVILPKLVNNLTNCMNGEITIILQ